MINIFIIEDHPVIVSGLKKMFHLSIDGIKITGDSNTVDELIARKDEYEIDILLLDLYLPGSRADENVKKLKSALPGKPIVIYTSEDSDVWKKKMFGLGVHAYITKNAQKEEIKFILNKAAQGEYTVSMKSEITANIHTASDNPIFTPNQVELLKLLCDVKKQEKIAKIKGTTVSNIEKTLKLMRKNIGVRSNLELVKYCVENGIV